MSAIAGLLHKNGKPADKSELERMSAALGAHGLDGGGIWHKDAVGLLQKQIVFTPEDHLERQPLLACAGQLALVSTSRLDNRPELMHALNINPHAGVLPDSHFILQAYLRWGQECPKHLIGDYTFAICNVREQSLLLAVSPFSGRPLHFHVSSTRLAFATMPKGLFALESVPRELDEDYLAKYLAQVPRKPETTFYRGICRVLPGQSLLIRRDQMTTQQFWERETSREIRLSSDAEYEEAFLDLYTRVIQDHLRSATPVGIMLSGGLDSSSVAAVAAPLLKAKQERLAAFTEVPRAGFHLPSEAGRYADETPFVQAIAGLYDNIDLNLVHTDDHHFLQAAEEYFHHAEAPFRNACNRPWFEAILREAQQQGVRVMLLGSQGNLTVSWKGEETLPHLIRQRRWGEALREARAMTQNAPGRSTGENLLRRGILPALPASLQRAVSRLRKHLIPSLPGGVMPALHANYAELHAIGTRTREARAYAHPEAFNSRSHRAKAVFLTTLAGSSLQAGYQAMFQTDLRDPTADQRIVEFCLALPENQFRRGAVTRRLLRLAMAGRLPAEVIWNQQRGLQSADWREKMAGGGQEMLSGLEGVARCSLASRLIDLSRLRQALQDVSRPADPDAAPDMELRRYLEQGLMTGRFIQWVKTGE